MRKFELPEDLYQFQKEDLDRLLSTDSNFCLFSEMGTGKTPIAIGLATLGNYKKTLIVCPKTLQLEWARQISDWTDTPPAVSRRGCYRRLETLFGEFLKGEEENPWFIVNYETFRTRRHLDVLDLYPFDLIILDEGHKLRNYKTSQTKGMSEFLSHHKNNRVLAMTGSPIVNNPADLHTLLCMVKPEKYSKWNRMDFINSFCYYYHTRHGVKITGTRNIEALRKQTAPFTIRRTKKEVLPYLPEKYYRKVLLEMNKEQRELYNQMEEELFVLLDSGEPLWAPSVLAQLTRLRQLNLDPKILGINLPSAKTDFLLDLIEGLHGEKLVVYSTFSKYIMYLHHILPQKHIIITGDIPWDERMQNVKQFQEDDSIKLALGTVQCMGEGITLTAASNVIICDRWWAPSVQVQAEDRLHRIGQPNAVQVIVPTAENSIDSSMDKVLEDKKRMSQEYLNEGDTLKEVVDDLRVSRRAH